MSDEIRELDDDQVEESYTSDDKDKRRLIARRKLEERLEEKRLQKEIYDDFYSF